MTKKEYLEFHEKFCRRMIEVTQKKNHDYTGGSDDPFFNFTRVEAVGITDTERGFLTRMYDKFARITTFVQKGVLQVQDESVVDTLNDLANYCALMAAYIESKRRQEQKKPGHGFDAAIYSKPGVDLSKLRFPGDELDATVYSKPRVHNTHQSPPSGIPPKSFTEVLKGFETPPEQLREELRRTMDLAADSVERTSALSSGCDDVTLPADREALTLQDIYLEIRKTEAANTKIMQALLAQNDAKRCAVCSK